ncbi:transferase [Sedimentibacter sp. SX930]|nr:transferase [Sedimentibacter sp. SX930]
MIKGLIFKMLLGKKASSETYINYLRKKGAKIGDRTIFFSPHQISVDVVNPWLIEIGDDVQITGGVRILTHDYSWSVLKHKYGEILGSVGKVKIGNNVFIGSDSILLKNTDIGNNVIVGAGSVVNNKIPDNCIAAGNPCKVIMSLDEFYEKRKKKQREEAVALAKAYFERTGVIPPKEIFHEYFFLFEDGSSLINAFNKKLELTGNFEESLDALKKNNNMFRNYDEFILKCNLNVGVSKFV